MFKKIKDLDYSKEMETLIEPKVKQVKEKIVENDKEIFALENKKYEIRDYLDLPFTEDEYNLKKSKLDKLNAEKALVEELSEIIEEARSTNIQDVRAKYYSDALDIVMQLAVELPTYQRDDLYAYNIKKIDESSLNTDLSPYTGLLSNIHTVKLLIK